MYSRFELRASGNEASATPAADSAPASCARTSSRARRRPILPVRRYETVTTGLQWPTPWDVPTAIPTESASPFDIEAASRADVPPTRASTLIPTAINELMLRYT